MIEINLLPKEYKKRGSVLSYDKKFLYAGVVAVAVMVVLAGLTFYQKQQLGQLEKLITKARAEEHRYKKDIAIIDALTEVKEKILARVSAIEKLDHRRSYYISMLEDLNGRIPEYLWMTGFSEAPQGAVVAQGAAQPGRPQPGNQQAPARPNDAASVDSATAAANPEKGNATIEGYAFSLNAIGTFIINLMKSDFFENIKLNRAVAEDVGQVTAYNFKISCDLKYNAHMTTDEIPDQQEGIHISSTHGQEDEDLVDPNDNYNEQ